MFARELQLLHERPLFGVGLIVESDLVNGDDALFRYRGSSAIASSASFRLFDSFGLSPIVQKWRMPNCEARNRSRSSRLLK